MVLTPKHQSSSSIDSNNVSCERKESVKENKNKQETLRDKLYIHWQRSKTANSRGLNQNEG